MQKEPTANTADLPAESVLVVEPSETVQSSARLLLASEGYNVFVAKSGTEARGLIGTHNPDLIVIDLLLSQESAQGILKELRRNGVLDPIPVVLLTTVKDLRGGLTGESSVQIVEENTEVSAVTEGATQALERHAAKDKLQALLRSLTNITVTDPLTGLHSRQYLIADLSKRMALAQRNSRTFSIALIDIDYFKRINDTFGHLVGDRVLQSFGVALKAAMRQSDVVARYGGEEFVIVMPDSSIDAAEIAAERVREKIEHLRFDEIGGEQITVSLGVTEWIVTDKGVETIIDRADRALYKAKSAGRNKVERSGDHEVVPSAD